MIIRNVKYYHGLPFEDYLKLEGISYSTIKGFEGPPTKGMILGTRVHQYINEPDQYDWGGDVERVRAIAESLRKVLGDAINFLKKEVSFTADFVHNGMVMKYKGRADMMIPGKIIVDLKVLSGYLEPSIKMFGYDRQISGYCLPTKAPIGLIVAFNKKTFKPETKLIKPDSAFWEYQVARYGVPESQNVSHV